jgi:hypothetical protein
MPVIAAFCDADVLVPIVSCDFFLTAAEAGVVDVIVSEAVLAEVEANLVENFPHLDPARLARRVGDMREFLADQIIDAGDLGAVAGIDVVNVKDRHVVGAALAAEADVLVTNDRRLRDELDHGSFPVRPMSADAVGELLWDLDHHAVIQVLDSLHAKRHRQPLTRRQLAQQLGRHFPALAKAWLHATER